MKTALSILQKVLVNHFYKLNGGLFMFLFYVFFGLPQDIKAFHVSIAAFIATSETALLLTIVLWLLYNLKCIDYTIKRIKEPQQLFLTSFEHMPPSKNFLCFSYVQFMLYLPVSAYALFVAIVAMQHHSYITTVIILLFIITVIPATALLYQRALKARESQSRIAELQFARLPKPAFGIPLFYILHHRKQMLLVTKIFSLFILWLFIKTFEPDHYDVRPVLTCFLLSAIANCTIVFEMKNFEDGQLLMYRNLPFSITKRFAQIVLAYAVLLVPELAFVWKAYPLYFNLADYWQIVIASTGLLAFLHTILYMGNTTMDTFIKIVFGAAMVLFFITLYNPGIWLGLFIITIAFVLYYSYYYDFEKQE